MLLLMVDTKREEDDVKPRGERGGHRYNKQKRGENKRRRVTSTNFPTGLVGSLRICTLFEEVKEIVLRIMDLMLTN